MASIIKAYDNKNEPIVEPGKGELDLVYFNVVRLTAGERLVLDLKGLETHFTPMSGRVDIIVDEETFENIGKRDSVWDGPGESVYAGTAEKVELVAHTDTEVAIAGMVCDRTFAPFFIPIEEIQTVDVGSNETKSRRRISHLLGQNGNGRAGNLLISELYADEGCWSGYPPHKHDTDGDGETDHQEVYHYRLNPETGFGVQFLYEDGDDMKAFATRNGDTAVIDKGYHPTATSPQHQKYVFTILAGRTARGLVQRFETTHEYIAERIPGIKDMRAAFK
ncbi:5-deoxy-glucuronate isomerase [Rhodobacteraceae bacterium RKSG542]|uniref:5-deoxy-glucuronate isomerase n=1 Tax=Pseudovibrio flavus TaxID=2529854 RepID=UPI0012BC8F8A|nr:5-deoxy-glucuronate isomerase [Pseudovibrio flavus]MTI18178.1 5-deoxy-glucuronate isomerase [Pseudovibrio flavus]